MEYVNIRGAVRYNIERDGERTILIDITDESAEKIREKYINAECKDNPLKKMEDGTICFKSHSKFEIKVFENNKELAYDEAHDRIVYLGAGSEIVINVKLGEGKFKGKKYQTAYLRAVNIERYVEKEDINPFDMDNFI